MSGDVLGDFWKSTSRQTHPSILSEAGETPAVPALFLRTFAFCLSTFRLPHGETCQR